MDAVWNTEGQKLATENNRRLMTNVRPEGDRCNQTMAIRTSLVTDLIRFKVGFHCRRRGVLVEHVEALSDKAGHVPVLPETAAAGYVFPSGRENGERAVG